MRRRVGTQVVGILLVLISLLAVFQSYRVTEAQKSFVQCQARYNDINNARTRALTEAAEKERSATRRVQQAEAALWLSPRIIREPGTPVDPSVLAAFRELQAALQHWSEVITETDLRRREHPVPPAPSSLCGTP